MDKRKALKNLLIVFIIGCILYIILIANQIAQQEVLSGKEEQQTVPETEVAQQEVIVDMKNAEEKDLKCGGENDEEKHIGEIYKGDLSIPIDYEFLISSGNRIYMDNILSSPIPLENNPLLLEVLKHDLDVEADFLEKFPQTESENDFFIFDFNGDSLDDYLVCLHGLAFTGSGGNRIYVFIQESDGSLREVFRVNSKVHHGMEIEKENGHSPIVALEERIEGFYTLVLPFGKNRLCKYDPETGRYQLQRYEDEEH